MALHLAVFALTGLGLVVVAWFMLPRSEQERFPSSAVSGVVGSLFGGLITWHYWPVMSDHFNFAALLTALVGAGVLFWAQRSYVRFEGADE